MHTHLIKTRLWVIAAGIALLLLGGITRADPPSRVARLGYLAGDVSFSPAGEDDWVQASTNRPMTSGDRLWSDRGSRAELQVGGAAVRIGGESSISILNLDDQNAQLQLNQGRLNVRVRRLERGQVLEIDTPNLAFTVREPADFRIEVDPDGYSTTIVVRRGQGEAYGDGAAYVIDAQQGYRFSGTDLDDYESFAPPGPDDFDRWSSQRDRRYDSSVSARYVSRDVVGYEDLDAYGSWRRDDNYGNVWYPNRVGAGWAPYHDGHWAWIDPWGWTWVDDAPWGFTVSHYGRWTNFGGTWGWVPGPAQTRAYYAPALVVFIGGNNFQLSMASGRVGGVAWFPLGPREVYRPSYRVSRGYFENVNRSNTVVNNTVINNYYNNSNVTNVVYVNREVPGAVVAVPRTTFVQSQPVSRSAVPVPRDAAIAGPAAFIPPVAPTDKSVRGATAGRMQPPARVLDRSIVARTAPPPPPVGFAPQQRQLAAQPGKPLDEVTRKQLKRAPSVPTPTIKVVAPTNESPPTSRPPPVPRPADQRGLSEERGPPRQEQQPRPHGQSPATAPTPAPVQAPTQVTQPAAAPPPPEPAGKAEQRGRPDQRGRPVAPPPATPAPAPPTAPAPEPARHAPAQPQGAPPAAMPATPGTPAAQPPATGEPATAPGKSEGKGKGKKKGADEIPPDEVPPPDPAAADSTT